MLSQSQAWTRILDCDGFVKGGWGYDLRLYTAGLFLTSVGVKFVVKEESIELYIQLA